MAKSFIYNNYKLLLQILHFGPRFECGLFPPNNTWMFKYGSVQRWAKGLGLRVMVCSSHGWMSAFLTGSSCLTQELNLLYFHMYSSALLCFLPRIEAVCGHHQLQTSALGLLSPQGHESKESCFVCLSVCLLACFFKT